MAVYNIKSLLHATHPFKYFMYLKSYLFSDVIIIPVSEMNKLNQREIM